MNQIEKNKRYEVESNDAKNRSYNDVLYLTNRQVSWLTASIVMLSFCVFIAGYFLGQRKALEQFNDIMEQEVATKSVIVDEAFPAHANVVNTSGPIAQNIVPVAKCYKAQLIGFGTSRAAHQFADRLQNKNMPVRVDERHSRTAQGKKIIWYQVTTEPFSDKQELLAFVEKIKKEERLKDIRIVSC
ncbi:MAG: SPOR domain-containing protein [Candidatus Dependentiae bacterium]